MKKFIVLLAATCLMFLSPVMAQKKVFRDVEITRSFNLNVPGFGNVQYIGLDSADVPGFKITRANETVEFKLDERFWINSNVPTRIIDSSSLSLLSLGQDTVLIGGVLPLAQNGAVIAKLTENWYQGITTTVNSLSGIPSSTMSSINVLNGRLLNLTIDTSGLFYNDLNLLTSDNFTAFEVDSSQISLYNPNEIAISNGENALEIILRNNLIINELPTDSAGLEVNSIWVDGDVLKIKQP